jgi:hypothetical protein
MKNQSRPVETQGFSLWAMLHLSHAVSIDMLLGQWWTNQLIAPSDHYW